MSRPRSEPVTGPADVMQTVLKTLHEASTDAYRGRAVRDSAYRFAVLPRLSALYHGQCCELDDLPDITVVTYRFECHSSDGLVWSPDLPGWPRLTFLP